MAKYFDSFPDVEYSGVSVKNITLRAKILDSYKTNASNFYPYTLADGETADNLAFDYYGDPGYNWIIYYCNDIIDPYYDWPVSNRDFDSYIKDKYGSVEACKSTTAFYRLKPQIFYVSRSNPNSYLSEAVYNPSTHGYDWDRVEIDNDYRMYATVSPSPSLWSAIDSYTYELEENEKKRYIKLLDKALVPSIERQLREIMNA